LRSATGNLNHFGVKRAPCKSTISYIYKTLDWKVFRDIYFGLLDILEPSLAKRRIYAARLKRNAAVEIVQTYLTDVKHEHILEDADIMLLGPLTSQKYPKHLRIVRVYDETLQREFIFLTNHMSWTAETISQLYHARWDIEVFFKAINQTLIIKT